MSEEDDVELWRRARRSVKLVGAVAVACVLVLLTVPVAVALEDTTDTLTGDEELLDDPSPSPTSSTTQTLEDETSEGVDSTIDTVEDTDSTDSTDTTEPVTDTTREVLAPSDEESPTGDDGQTDDPETTDQTDDGGGTAATDGDGEQAGTVDGDPDRREPEQPVGPLPAEPRPAADARRPLSPASVGGTSETGPDPAMLAKLSEIDNPWADLDGEPIGPPPSLQVNPYAADVVVPIGPRSTRDILDLLGGDAALFGEVARILAPFPVAGPARYSDDFGAPRHVPSYHPHAGTDVFAPRGTPIIASADGVIGGLAAGTAIGGNSLKVYAADGTYFYYSHLDGFAPGIADGVHVELGQVIGYVGDTGNAVGTPPHLHFEIHPAGGGPVNPLPYLDRWLANARAAAGSLVDANSVVMEPQVAPPADAPAEATPQQQAGPASPQVATAAQPDQDLIGSESETSPMSLLILIGAAGVLFVMMRRPQEASVPAGSPVPSAGAAPTASFPSTRSEAVLELLPLPGEEQDAVSDEDEFEWITLGA